MRLISRRSMLSGTAALAVAATLAACSSSSDSGADDGVGSVYYLNSKPENEAAFKEIATIYKEKTGVDVKVVTAGSGTYEQTQKTEFAKSNPPTLFVTGGPVGYKNWKDYCLDITDSEWVKGMSDNTLVVKGEDDKTYAAAVAVEGYGLIYNQAVLDKYFALSGAKATAVSDITSFETLKAVVEDMQARKAEIGIQGAFACTSLAPGEEWRYYTHLTNYPLYYEFRDAGVQDLDEVKFTYNENYKKIFDLYLANSTCTPAETTAKTVTDSMAEFALGKVAFVQNGNWAWSQIAEVEGNTVKEEDIHFMPIYMGVKGEEKSGIAIGTEAFWAVNAKASEADQKATLDFMAWLFTSDEGAKLASEKLGFNAPYTAFANLLPSDPLGREVAEYMTNKDLYTVNWVFQVMPSQDFKDNFAQHLSQYATGSEDWKDVVEYFVTEWATEKAEA